MAENVAEQRQAEYPVIHDKTHGARRGGHDDERIHETDVIADQQRGTLVRNVFDPLGAQAITHLDQ